MASPAVKRIKTQRTVELKSLTGSAEWLRQEIAGFTTDAALEENREQVRLGNDPTRVVLDGEKATELDGNGARRLASMRNVVFVDFQRKIQIFYTTTEVLAEAFEAAWNQLKALTPVRSGKGLRSMSFWCSDLENPGRSREFAGGNADPSSQVAAVKKWILESRSERLLVSIQGPRTEYRRAMIYQGRNRPKRGGTEYLAPRPTSGDPLLRFSGAGRRGTVTERRKEVMRGPRAGRVLVQYQLNRAIHKIVQRRMRNQFRDVYFGYRFIPNPPGKTELPLYNSPKWKPSGRNVHIPILYMWKKRSFRGGRGRLR